MKSSLQCIGVIVILISSLPSVAHGQSPYESSTQTIGDSNRSESPSSCQCVAFRLDDIQDYFLDSVQVDIIQTFENNNASLTVGIIGNYFGEDLYLISSLKESLSNNDYKMSTTPDGAHATIEVASHGWNHEDFTLFSRDEQYSLIRDSNKKIFDKLGVTPIVFIPPYNNLNNDTLKAAQENGIQYISANATTSAPYILPSHAIGSGNQTNGSTPSAIESPISNFASLASTGDLSSDDTEWAGYLHNDTFHAVQQSVSQLGYAVVTMHPQEYSIRSGLNYTNQVDQKQIKELESLIDSIRMANLKIVTISEIDKQIPSIPEFQSNYIILSVAVLMVPLTILRLDNKNKLPVKQMFARLFNVRKATS